MVIGANSMLIRIPNLSCGEWLFIGYKQLNCDMVQNNNSVRAQLKSSPLWHIRAVRRPWGEAPVWLDSSVLLCFACSSPLQSVPPALLHSGSGRHLRYFVFSILAPAREIQLFSLSLEGKMCISRQKSPPLVPDWSVIMQMRTPSPHSVIGPQNTVLIE